MATQKIAVRRIKRGSDGQIKVVYVDAQTQQELTSLVGYTINSQNELAKEDFPHGLQSMLDMPHGLSAIEGFPLTPTLPGMEQTDTSTSGTGFLNTEEWLRNLNGRDADTYTDTGDRTQANNFGYIDKPGFLSVASGLPGIPGLIGKGVNAAINANNVAAVNAAREALGLPEQSTKEALKGVVQDNKGVVAEVTIGKQQVPIGLEATTPSGRTTMTPAEALSRARANNVGIEEATEEAIAEAEAKFAEEYGKQTQGFFGNLKDIVKDVIDEKGPLADVKSPFAGIKSPLADVKSPLADVKSPFTKSDSKAKGKSKEAKTESKPSGKTTGIATPETAKKVAITPGIGLGNLTNRTAKTDLSDKSRGVAPDSRLMEVLQQAVEQALGPGYQAVVSSGTYSPEQQAAINEARAQAYQAAIAAGKSGKQAAKAANAAGKAAGQVGTTRHTTGKAADFYVIDPNGNQVKSTEALKAVAATLASLGITGLGLGNPGGYMGGTSIHADFVNPSKATGWGGLGQQFKDAINDSIGLPNKFSPTGIPTPTASPRTDPVQDVATKGEPSPTQEAPTGFVTGYTGESYGQGNDAMQSLQANFPASTGFVPTQTRADITDPLLRDPRTIQEITAIAKTIAGELGSKTLARVRSGDEARQSVARQEIAAILGTIENRAASTRHGGNLGGVLTGSQYNSLTSGNLSTTEANFAEFGDFIIEAIKDYYEGTNPSPVPNATHYWNPSIVSPSWSNYSRGGTSTDVGEHTFADITVPGTNRSEYARGLPETVDVSGIGRPSPTTTAVPNDPVTTAPAQANIGLTGNVTGTAGIGASGKGNVSVNPSTGVITFDVVTPEEYAAAIAASTQPSFTGNVPSFSYVSPTEAFANYGVTTSTVGPGAGYQTSGLGAFGSAPGSGYGSQTMAGLQGMTSISSSPSAPTGIAGTGIGYGFSAGSLGGSASGFGSGFGAPGTSGYGGFSGGADFSGGTNFSGAGFGSPGDFGGSFGGGYGSQSTAGASREAIGAGGYDAPSAASSFGGFSAGSLGGSASGVGTGFGSVGTSNTGSPGYSGFSPSGLGNYSGGTSSSGKGGGTSSSGVGGGFSAGQSSAGVGVSANASASSSGSGGGAGGDTVLCTYFHEKGKLSDKLYEADSNYGSLFVSEDTMNGYKLWAEPIVEYLKKKEHPVLEEFLFFFVKGWATEMAYRMGVEKKSNFIGRQVCNFGEAICGLIGKATRLKKRPLKENI